MRIYDQNLTGTAAAESGRSQETQKPDREATTPPSGSGSSGSGDRVELSSALASVSRALASYHSDRTAKVQSLTAQFQAGSYQPSSQATSQGMVAEALGAGAK
jgi:flagellar biosynthesis anti-sigma factor FlgM